MYVLCNFPNKYVIYILTKILTLDLYSQFMGMAESDCNSLKF